MREARAQFASVDPGHSRLWIVWASAEAPIGADSQVDRIMHSLYGARMAFEVIPPHREVMCFHAAPSILEKFPEIDGVLVANLDARALTFAPNERSPRHHTVRSSKLVRILRENGVERMLVAERVRDSVACIVPPEVRDQGPVAVQRHVQQVTGIYHLTFSHEQEFMSFVAVDSGQLSEESPTRTQIDHVPTYRPKATPRFRAGHDGDRVWSPS